MVFCAIQWKSFKSPFTFATQIINPFLNSVKNRGFSRLSFTPLFIVHGTPQFKHLTIIIPWLHYQNNNNKMSLTTTTQCSSNPTLFALKNCLSSSKTGAFFILWTLVLTLLTKFVPNSTIRRCYFCSNFSNFDSKLAPNLHSNLVLIVHICIYQKRFHSIWNSMQICCFVLSKWCKH